MGTLWMTTPLGTMHVMQVETGTSVKDERTGDEIIVDDNTCAIKGRVIFCTERVYENLKTHVRSQYDA